MLQQQRGSGAWFLRVSCQQTTCHPAESAQPMACCILCLQPKVKLLIDGNFQDSKADKWVNVTNPVRVVWADQSRSAAGVQTCHTWGLLAMGCMSCSVKPTAMQLQLGKCLCSTHASNSSEPADRYISVPAGASAATVQATQEVVSRLPETTAAEFNAAVAAAKAAFPAWRATPVPSRQRVMLKFQELIRANWVSDQQ